jgi:addiction module HigA family antidote
MGHGGFVWSFMMEMHMRSKSSTITRRGSLVPVHPGTLLARELNARESSALSLALALRVPANRISEIVKGRRGITAETALRLGQYFGSGADFWLRLQMNYDLALAEKKHGAAIRKEVSAA